MAALIDRRAFSDSHGLAELCRGVVPSITDTKRRIFITERRTNFGFPDHFYKGYLADRMTDVGAVSELPYHTLTRLAERYLERRHGKIVVRLDRFAEWHELLPFISPLAVLIAFLVNEDPPTSNPTLDPRVDLEREIGDTAVLGPHDLALDDLIERKGLNELHMHLNGSTELDIVWADACTDPDGFYGELLAASRKSELPVAELYEQLEFGLTPYKLYKRMRALRRVRHYMADILGAAPGYGSHLRGFSKLTEAMTADLSDGEWNYERQSSLSEHPTSKLYGRRRYSRLINEAAWLYRCLSHLRHNRSDTIIGTGLYFNFLLLNQVTRLAVQQPEESGFDQFQKYTLLGTREKLERHYEERFRQLNIASPHTLLSHLEGRFAPKSSITETENLVLQIIEDYLAFRGCGHRGHLRKLHGKVPPCLVSRPCDGDRCARHGRPDAELSLVAHFIKRPPSSQKDKSRGYLDSDLRADLDKQARHLRELVTRRDLIRTVLVGIDAASNELHAPPEPFAPAFRIMRQAGVGRATFHVGEDFRHLLSGIRSVAEAITYLDLRAGDRIGHAIALGVDPNLWRARTADRIMLNRHDLLDDAVFAQQNLIQIHGFGEDVRKLTDMIARLSHDIYGLDVSPVVLSQAWRLRDIDIREIRQIENRLAQRLLPVTASNVVREARVLAREVMDKLRARELDLVADRVEHAASGYAFYRKRHLLDETKRPLCESLTDFLSIPALCALQDIVLAETIRLGIALEALPTSNIRISVYQTMAEHHIFRWLGLAGPALNNRPTVVIGSDDPGIFCTNIRNEYAVISSVLRSDFGKSAAEAAEILEKLNNNGRIHRFRPSSPVSS
ncbi:hypothetical protein HFO09_30465 [Rhizobium laguerreae]|uniref:hypothetical protein n=1 Tax=Rhizobium laguerreae TaxID=1076926 RepID=UPI001C90D07D|nr:hypothetical protein [Rhizobium laguerreae]MBY3258828.1 hypothetical protein [Rhizobium laguerreae]MBY3282031.1 hypothetical protein [Rhizobium laguerreae]MBY3293321.1 hypothetical protein [Rhizobium laguerreae]